MDIIFSHTKPITAKEVSRVFKNSGIRRPSDDLERIERMIKNADIVIGAWLNDQLIGIARAITDYSYCCYLSDLAVDRQYQKRGIGKALIHYLREQLSEEVALILIAAPEAIEYYPKLGFEQINRTFIIPRKK
ncbi:GNAT family N-acetyltransferase [Cohnella laeviribosi]|uniref:GNAT family N-acetyltransferase n=1 Tax=Cohnella laeviribosi TaxID=380174 RepID=UPI003D23F776